jgi:hypothetical protein
MGDGTVLMNAMTYCEFKSKGMSVMHLLLFPI